MLQDQLQQEIHVWFAHPDHATDAYQLDLYRGMLSAQEFARYRRFHLPEDRHLYLTAHALLRLTLSKYAEIQPADWTFSRGAHGRPEISNPGMRSLRFNLTHTAGLVGCVVALGNDCGIDTERLDAGRHLTGISQRMFSTEEHRQLKQLKQLNDSALIEAFYSRWTLREAFVKAKGTGISYPTRKLNFDIDNDDTIRVRFDSDLKEDQQYWQFRLLRPTTEHIAATALRTDKPGKYRIVEHSFDNQEHPG